MSASASGCAGSLRVRHLADEELQDARRDSTTLSARRESLARAELRAL